MTINLNGKPAETSAIDLASLLVTLAHAPTSVATAVNGDFVAHTERANCKLAEGDRVDIIAPMSGG